MVVHWVMGKRYGFPTGSKLYDHTLEKVLENDSTKISRDISEQADYN